MICDQVTFNSTIEKLLVHNLDPALLFDEIRKGETFLERDRYIEMWEVSKATAAYQAWERRRVVIDSLRPG